jgi:hypothetical protein
MNSVTNRELIKFLKNGDQYSFLDWFLDKVIIFQNKIKRFQQNQPSLFN